MHRSDLTRLALCTFLLALTASAADAARVDRDVQYGDADHALTTLDVYTPANAKHTPVVVYIHGGGWRRGDKANVAIKPRAFNAKGYAFISINYRLHPDAHYQQQARDVAAALRYVHDHAADYAAAPDQLFLMGHSAGAHLAALVAVDHRYLDAAGLDPNVLRGIILLDGGGYDIPTRLQQGLTPRAKTLFEAVFTRDPATQRDASPVHHIQAGQPIPPFLILHVADRPVSRHQSNLLADRLTAAGYAARALPAENKTHGTINRELGQPDDPPTLAVFEFLNARRNKPEPTP